MCDLHFSGLKPPFIWLGDNPTIVGDFSFHGFFEKWTLNEDVFTIENGDFFIAMLVHQRVTFVGDFLFTDSLKNPWVLTESNGKDLIFLDEKCHLPLQLFEAQLHESTPGI